MSGHVHYRDVDVFLTEMIPSIAVWIRKELCRFGRLKFKLILATEAFGDEIYNDTGPVIGMETQFAGERILKIGEHLAKLRTKWLIVSCVPFALRFFPQICRTRHISRITCVWRTETVTNHCYVIGQIHLTSLSTDIKILQTSFDALTDRLTPSMTDRLLIMYGILLRHLFLCCRSCVPWVMRFLIQPM